MRIGIDATCLPSSLAGAGRYIHGIVHGLGRVDHENEYFIFIKENDAEQFSYLPENVQLVCLPKLSRPLRLLWQHAMAGVQARKLGLDVWHGPHYAVPNFTNGTARVATFHDLGVFHHPQLYPLEKRLYFRRAMQKAFGRARHIIAVSEATTRNLNEVLAIQSPHGRVAAPCVTTILSGVDEKFFGRVAPEEIATVRRKHGLAEPYVLFVGTLEKRKNLDMLVRAFHEFCERGHHDHVLALAGQSGNGSPEISAAVNELHLQERVRLLGYVSEAHLPALYQGADLFVMPSLYEGFGFPLLEAMAGGVVALASNNSSLRELAMHPQMLCEETSSAWAAKMESLLFDKTLRYELTRYGVYRAKEFSWQNASEKLRAVYESSTSKRVAHARNGHAMAKTQTAIHASRTAWVKLAACYKFLASQVKRLRFTPSPSLHDVPVATDTRRPASQNSSARPFAPPLSLAAAIKKTLAYADLFDYPLTAEEIHYGLIEHAATRFEVTHELARLCARGEIIATEGFYCVPGRAASIAVRERRRRASEELLRRHRRALRLIENFPFIRSVALSGALAFQNAEADDDLDLFIIVESGRLWLVYFGLVLLMKALGQRRKICLNCLIDTAHLEITDRDFFVAHQIVFLRALYGAQCFRAFFQANAWCLQYLPQMDAEARIDAYAAQQEPVQSKPFVRNVLEFILRTPLFNMLESLVFRLYRRRIRRRTAHLDARAIMVAPGQIKLFTNDHRFHSQESLELRMHKSDTHPNGAFEPEECEAEIFSGTVRTTGSEIYRVD